jgi:hypothetical protein
MIHKFARHAIAALGLVALCALPAAANQLNITVTATCGCTYTVTATGGGMTPNVPVTIVYQFGANVDGVDYMPAGSGTIHTNSDANGTISVSIPGNPLNVPCTGKVVNFGIITASLQVDGDIPEGFGFNPPAALDCTGTPPPPPPPTGKSLEIGPSSMEGHLQIRPGDFISGGYSFKFASGTHAASVVTITSTLTLPYTCPQGGGPGGNIVINLGTQTVNVPANNTDWQPTGDANNVLSWAGSGPAPNGCNGNIMDNSKGAIFDTTISQNPDAGQLLNWRFKYRDPNAKGKGNVNCLDTSDPRRAAADVCGASWSGTVKDP